MNAGIIVGYITQPNGSPVSGAEIWISPPVATGGEVKAKSTARTDARGYFQLTFSEADSGANVGIGGKLNVSVGARAGFENRPAAESRFRVTGYLINETVLPTI